MVREIGHRATEGDRQLRAHHITEPGEQQAKVHAVIAESGGRAKDIARAPFADDIEQRHVLVFVHQAERLAHALRRHGALAQ